MENLKSILQQQDVHYCETTDEVLRELDEKVQIIGIFDESKMGSTSYAPVIEFIKQYQSSNMIELNIDLINRRFWMSWIPTEFWESEVTILL